MKKQIKKLLINIDLDIYYKKVINKLTNIKNDDINDDDDDDLGGSSNGSPSSPNSNFNND